MINRRELGSGRRMNSERRIGDRNGSINWKIKKDSGKRKRRGIIWRSE